MGRWSSLSASLAVATLGLSLAVHADDPAAPAAPAPIVVPHADTPPVIDGVPDEAIWQRCAPTQVFYPSDKKQEVQTESLATTWLAWDEHYLYIAYEWNDANVTALPGDDIQGPPTNKRQSAMVYHPEIPVDLIEFFVAASNRKHFWELHHNALNTWNDILITMLDKDDPGRQTFRMKYGINFGAQEYLADDQQYTLAMAVAMKNRADGKPSTINVATDADTGYTAEIRIPWVDLLAPWKLREKDPERTGKPMPWHMAGHEIRMLVVVQNPDFPGRGYYHSSPTFPGGWFHTGYDTWLVYQMAPPATAE